MKNLIALLVILALVPACQEQAPQLKAPTPMSYRNLPSITTITVSWRDLQAGTVPVELQSMIHSVTPYAAQQLSDVYSLKDLNVEALGVAVSQILKDDVPRYAAYAKSKPRTIATGGCDCGGTHICEFWCQKYKIMVTDVPNCCSCYGTIGGGGVIYCKEGSNCDSKSIICTTAT